jgi:hypothetical protein
MNCNFRSVRCSAALVACALPGGLAAQTAAPSDARPDSVVQLSPFEVKPEDVGYQAANTTSGSRLNARLKDTPAAISPFTPEFLADIGATIGAGDRTAEIRDRGARRRCLCQQP